MVAESVLDAAEEAAILTELRRRCFLDYAQACHPRLSFHPWQVLLCERLQAWVEAIERMESPRLMVFVPPQFGKSTIVSQALPAWIAGRHPEWPGILASYAASLASKNGRWIRNQLNSALHRQTFPKSRLAGDSQSKDTMTLVSLEEGVQEGGQILARGIGGGTTGNPAMYLITDDPFSDRAQAESETIRNNVDDWHGSVATTRLGPGGGELVMNTRWHEDDLAGRLLERAANSQGDEFSDKWEVLSLPAEWMDGAPRDLYRWDTDGSGWLICRYRIQDLRRKKSALTARDWLSMFQQTPGSPSGTYFKVDLVNQLPGAAPKLDRVYQAWDLALTPERAGRGDYSVGATMGIDHVGRYWLLDLVRGRWSPDECARQMIAFWRKHQAARVWMEGGPPFLGVQPSLVHAMRRSGVWIPYEAISHGGKAKDVRAIAIRGVINGGNLYVPSDAEWWPHVRSELAAFPSGRTDDCVDPLAYLGLKSGEMLPNKDGRPPPKLPIAAEKSAMVKRQLAEIQERRKQQARDPLGWR